MKAFFDPSTNPHENGTKSKYTHEAPDYVPDWHRGQPLSIIPSILI